MSSVGTASVGHPEGISSEPGKDCWHCRDCGKFFLVPTGAVDPRRCPTPGCRRKTGFGKFAGVPAVSDHPAASGRRAGSIGTR